MAKITKFNKLHLELIPRLWSNEKIPSPDYFKMLSDIGVDIKKISFPDKNYPEGVTHVFRIENEETIQKEGALGQSVSRLISYISFEKIGNDYFLVQIEPSNHLANWLWRRNQGMEYKEMKPVRPIDAVIEKAHEITLLFIQNKQKFERPVSGTMFLAFLEENKVSPFIWLWDYCDRKDSGYSSTTLSKTRSCFWLPIPKVRVEPIPDKYEKWKNKSLADRSIIIVEIDF